MTLQGRGRDRLCRSLGRDHAERTAACPGSRDAADRAVEAYGGDAIASVADRRLSVGKRRAPRPKPRVLLLGVPTPRKITPRGASPCRRCRWHLEFWSGARNGGCPRRTGRVLTESRILPCRGRAELAIPLPPSRSCFAPSRSPLPARCPQRRTLALVPVRYPGQDASGGGAGYRPRVLKRYYEPVINLATVLDRKRPFSLRHLIACCGSADTPPPISDDRRRGCGE